jgi:hypothetical protein
MFQQFDYLSKSNLFSRCFSFIIVVLFISSCSLQQPLDRDSGGSVAPRVISTLVTPQHTVQPLSTLILPTPTIESSVSDQKWNFVQIPDLNFGDAVAADKSTGMWLAADYGLYYFDNKSFQHFDTPFDISTLFIDRQGNIWAGGGILGNRVFGPAGILKYDKNEMTTFFVVPPPDTSEAISGTIETILPLDTSFTIYEDQNGQIWIADSFGWNIAIYDGNSFKHFDPSILGIDQEAWLVFGDYEGGIWLADAHGLYKYADEKLYQFSELDQWLPGLAVRSMTEDKYGTKWFIGEFQPGTGWGLFFIKENTITSVPLPQETDRRNTPSTIYADREGNVWIGGWGVIIRYSDGNFLTYGLQDHIPQSPVKGIAQDQQGRIWFALGEAILRYEMYTGKPVTFYSTSTPVPTPTMLPLGLQEAKQNLISHLPVRESCFSIEHLSTSDLFIIQVNSPYIQYKDVALDFIRSFGITDPLQQLQTSIDLYSPEALGDPFGFPDVNAEHTLEEIGLIDPGEEIGCPSIKIIVDNVDVYSGPGYENSIISKVNLGTRFDIIGSNMDNSWWKVCCTISEGRTGWLLNTPLNIQIEGDVAVVRAIEVLSESQ